MLANDGNKRTARARTGIGARESATAATTRNGETTLSDEELRSMIAQAAYFRAAKREFAPGGELGDWIAAEREVNTLLKEGRMGTRPVRTGVGPVEGRVGVPAETPPADATAR